MSAPCTCDWSGACVPCRLARARETPAGAALLREGHEAGFTAAIRFFWQGVCFAHAREADETAAGLVGDSSGYPQMTEATSKWYLTEAALETAKAAQYRAWAGEA